MASCTYERVALSTLDEHLCDVSLPERINHTDANGRSAELACTTAAAVTTSAGAGASIYCTCADRATRFRGHATLSTTPRNLHHSGST